jgi:hypothetical protein
MHIYVAKNRSGPLGENVFGWEGKTGTVYELRQDEFDEYCTAMESAGLERPKFNWFTEPEKQNISDDVPVADRGRSGFKSFQKNKKEPQKPPRDFTKKVEARVRQVVEDPKTSNEIKQLAQQQAEDMRVDEQQTVSSDQPRRIFKRGS